MNKFCVRKSLFFVNFNILWRKRLNSIVQFCLAAVGRVGRTVFCLVHNLFHSVWSNMGAKAVSIILCCRSINHRLATIFIFLGQGYFMVNYQTSKSCNLFQLTDKTCSNFTFTGLIKCSWLFMSTVCDRAHFWHVSDVCFHVSVSAFPLCANPLRCQPRDLVNPPFRSRFLHVQILHF